MKYLNYSFYVDSLEEFDLKRKKKFKPTFCRVPGETSEEILKLIVFQAANILATSELSLNSEIGQNADKIITRIKELTDSIKY